MGAGKMGFFRYEPRSLWRILPFMTRLSALLIAVIAALFLGGCSTPAAAETGPHSELIDVTLPPGSVPACCGKYPGQEVWLVTTPYDFTVQSLRQQLPIFHDYYGLPWCTQDINGQLGLTQWDWVDSQNSIVVAVDSTGTVTITRGPDDEGRQGAGCDSP